MQNSSIPDSRQADRTLYDLISAHRSALMGFAALWIILYHVWERLFKRVPVIGAIERFIVHFGYFGVEIFLFLSGMGLVFSIGRRSLSSFYWSRYSRLALPYASIAIVRALVEHWTPMQALKLLTGYAFLFEYAYSFLWYVQAIAVYYLLFPLYYAGLRRSRRPVAFTVVALCVWEVLTVLANLRFLDDLLVLTDRIPVFLLGLLLGELAKRKRLPAYRKALPGAMLAFIVGLGVCLADFYHALPTVPHVLAFPIANLLLALPLGLFLAMLLDRPARRPSRTARALAFFGTLSLELYCVQDLYARDILIVWLNGLPALPFNIAAIALSIAISWPAHWAFTRILNAVNRRISSQKALP